MVDSKIVHDEFISVDNALKEYDETKENIKNANNIKWLFIVLNI